MFLNFTFLIPVFVHSSTLPINIYYYDYSFLIVEYQLLGVSTYEFEVEVIGMEGYTLLWDFGDDSYSNLDQVVHTFESNGTYLVTILASNGEVVVVEELIIELSLIHI